MAPVDKPWAYRNNNNGEVYRYAVRQRRLDKLPNWELIIQPGDQRVGAADRLAGIEVIRRSLPAPHPLTSDTPVGGRPGVNLIQLVPGSGDLL